MITVAVVPAAGSGSRLGARRPKQFLRLGGVPLLVHTLRALASVREINGIIVAAPPADVPATRRLLLRYRVPRLLAVVAGGKERQESVWLALQAVPDESELLIVHDAVRPFITPKLLRAVIAEARRHGAATCGLPVSETLKRVREGIVETTVEREGLWLVQTPQAFRRGLIWEAHEKAKRDGFWGTDDAVLVERLGHPVRMVPGLPENLKITTRQDLSRARAFASLQRRRA
jgi:2-C-methyl-D-erythritol 4-phosphate cytidylyltransferase